MQTFMPCDSYRESASCLDYRRQGKQRVECKQILNVLLGISTGWANHPAVGMWRGHEDQLARYAVEVCVAWRARGYKDTLLPWFIELSQTLRHTSNPAWMGDSDFHMSHKSNLIRKNPDYYGSLWPDVPADLPYIWPSMQHAARSSS